MTKKRLYEGSCDRKITIKVTEVQYEKLEKMKISFGLGSVSDVIRFLIDYKDEEQVITPPAGKKIKKIVDRTEIPPPPPIVRPPVDIPTEEKPTIVEEKIISGFAREGLTTITTPPKGFSPPPEVLVKMNSIEEEIQRQLKKGFSIEDAKRTAALAKLNK